MRSRLDLSELLPLDRDAATEIRALERRLGAHVAVYRAGACGRPHGLCLTYRAALLTPRRRACLTVAEAARPGVVLVAYARPLQRHDQRPGPDSKTGRQKRGDKVADSVATKTTAGATHALALLLDTIDQAYDKPSWHGTNLRGSIRKLTLAELCRRPGKGRHNIWEIVVHTAYWKYAVWRRILGEKRGSFVEKGSNWFVRPVRRTEAAWKADLRLLQAMHDSMREAIAGVAPRDLPRKSRGSRHTNTFMITGVAAHDIYHAAQIQLLKRLYRSVAAS
jgi:uncharacterized damage-inducible protein DinB